MELSKALSMPFQLASLLFVAVTSLLVALIHSIPGPFAMMGLPLGVLLTIWQTQYAFKLIDDAANGVKEPATADVDLLDPWGDMRCWVHPLLGAGIVVLLLTQPQIPVWPVWLAAAALFPASLGAIAMTGRAFDALNPVLMARVMHGLGYYYPLAVLWIVLCVGVGSLISLLPLWEALRIAAAQLLLLLIYAFIGGAIFIRRLDLGFEPLASPEREQERGEKQHIARRQQMIDGLYSDLRVRHHADAATSLRQWIAQATPQQLSGDVRAILDAGARWSEPGLVQLLRGLVQQLLSMRQPALAFAAVEVAIANAPTFAPEQESDAVAVIRYALQTGRKRLAATLLDNFMGGATNHAPGPDLLELRSRLQDKRELA